MHRTFVVSRLQFRPASTREAPVTVESLGFSMVQLMSVSGHDTATGVRTTLKIQDSSALEVLSTYHAQRTRLEWTFHFGGGAQSIRVPLRWTKFHQPSGTVQVVRNVVMRDLIAEAEAKQPDGTAPHGTQSALNQEASPPSSHKQSGKQPPKPSPPVSTPAAVDPTRLWPSVLGNEIMVRPRYRKGSVDLIADLRHRGK
ncbi:hypothetical protein BSZ35_00350 [Salinibacter sp. 10B]|uniref:hypothetical protein n=1 Tax=Salinibacter sp. 10B TaxID=1923971 RepID=UPI000CF4EE3A|nr:hypothetical protein [Salinibacter sp. 10B]PQJ33253.1 hypothetical protein BSZ35_00350 [Salinibacter sp. 10B]